MPSDEQVKKFQELYRNRYGKEISGEKAREIGSRLVLFIEAIFKPLELNEADQGNFINHKS